MKDISEMTLKEKNSLYIQQKKEIERLKNINKKLEEKLFLNHESNQFHEENIIVDFLSESCIRNKNKKVEAKILFEAFKKWLSSKGIDNRMKNRTFYSVLLEEGLSKKKGTKNKLFIYGLEWKYASKTDN
ncbi:primase-like DNA-binding domain-containing protein [Peribacillus muralis]|uniref:primase-like DNA-binding domain-containing protein n=1 Tax=Peribacillus muralis TaxID=264697 RepID=UPI003CFCA394